MQLLATLMAALLLFSGCADDPKPKEPKNTSTPRPTATAPTMPAEASKPSPEGPAAFVSHFIEVFNYAARTGDTSQLLSLSSGCAPCSKYANDFEEGFKRGERLSRDLWQLKKSEVVANEDGIDVVASVQGEEAGKPITYELGFTLPTNAPYRVEDIFNAVTK